MEKQVFGEKIGFKANDDEEEEEEESTKRAHDDIQIIQLPLKFLRQNLGLVALAKLSYLMG